MPAAAAEAVVCASVTAVTDALPDTLAVVPSTELAELTPQEVRIVRQSKSPAAAEISFIF